MAFEPGHTKSKGRRRQFADALSRAIAQSDGDVLRKVSEKLIEQASSGEAWAIKELADRLDGRPRQQTELVGDNERDLTIVVRRFSEDRLPAEGCGVTADGENGERLS